MWRGPESAKSMDHSQEAENFRVKRQSLDIALLLSLLSIRFSRLMSKGLMLTFHLPIDWDLKPDLCKIQPKQKA